MKRRSFPRSTSRARKVRRSASPFDHHRGGHDEKIDATAVFGGQWRAVASVRFFDRSPLRKPRLARDAHALRSRSTLDLRRLRFRENRFLNLVGLGYGFGKTGAILKVGSSVVLNHRNFDPVTDEAILRSPRSTTPRRASASTRAWQTIEIDGNVIADLRDNAGATSNGFTSKASAAAFPRSTATATATAAPR
jgi:hypothetical protein